MNKSTKRIFLATIVLILLVISSVALSGCHLKTWFKRFRPDNHYTQPEITVSVEDNKTEIKANESVTLTATTKGIDNAGDITWKAVINGQLKVISGQGTSVRFSMIDGKKGTYSIWAEAGSVQSNKVTINVKALSAEGLVTYLKVDGKKVPNGETYRIFKVSNNVLEYCFNLSETDLGTIHKLEYEISIFSGDTLIAEGKDSLTNVQRDLIARFDYSFASEKYTIKAKLTINKGTPEEKTISLTSYVEASVPVQKLGNVELEGAVKAAGKHYYTTTGSNKIKAKINVLPVEAKPAKVEYYLKSEDNLDSGYRAKKRLVSEGNEKSDEIILSEGKNILMVKVDNFAPVEVEIYHNRNSEKEYLDREFYWYGRYRSSYMHDAEDYELLIGYLYSLQKSTEWPWDVCVSSAVKNANLQDYIEGNKYVVSAGNITYRIETTPGGDDSKHTVTMLSKHDKEFATPKYESEDNPSNPIDEIDTSAKLKQVQVNREFRKNVLGMDVNKRTRLPVDDFEETKEVSTSEELYQALQSFKKPIITNPEVQAIYNKARAILLDIIDNKMTPYDKVLAIYDYLVAQIHYDFRALNMQNGNYGQGYVPDTKDLYAYFLEGVFKKNTSVCDGKSKAFVLLCGMEGIESRRITGDAGGPHAWNKVFVATPGDVPKWYNIDTTQGEMNAGQDAYLSHKKFLFSYSKIAGYKEDVNGYTIEDDNHFDYYANTTYKINGKNLKLKSNTLAEFHEQMSIIKSNPKLKVIDLDCRRPVSTLGFNLIRVGSGDTETIIAERN